MELNNEVKLSSISAGTNIKGKYDFLKRPAFTEKCQQTERGNEYRTIASQQKINGRQG